MVINDRKNSKKGTRSKFDDVLKIMEKKLKHQMFQNL